MNTIKDVEETAKAIVRVLVVNEEVRGPHSLESLLLATATIIMMFAKGDRSIQGTALRHGANPGRSAARDACQRGATASGPLASRQCVDTGFGGTVDGPSGSSGKQSSDRHVSGLADVGRHELGANLVPLVPSGPPGRAVRPGCLSGCGDGDVRQGFTRRSGPSLRASYESGESGIAPADGDGAFARHAVAV